MMPPKALHFHVVPVDKSVINGNEHANLDFMLLWKA